MDWPQYLLIIALIFYLLATLQYFQLWKEFKKVNVGAALTTEVVAAIRKRNKIALVLFLTGIVLNLITIVLN